MTKPLAGKRLFEAMGRRDQSLGRPMLYRRGERVWWPKWARSAWARGWINQGQTRITRAAKGDVS